MSAKSVIQSLLKAIETNSSTSTQEEMLTNMINEVTELPEFNQLPLEVIRRILSHSGPIETFCAKKILESTSKRFKGDAVILLKSIRLHDTSIDSLCECFASIHGVNMCDKMREKGLRELEHIRRHIVHLEREMTAMREELSSYKAAKERRRRLQQKDIEIEVVVDTKKPLSPKTKLLFNGVDESENIFSCIRKGNTEQVKELCKKDPSKLKEKGRSDRTPLMYCANYGRIDIAKYLIENGARVNKTDGHKNTALHIAAMSGETEMVKFLLSKGARADEINAKGETPLISAITKSQVDSAFILLKKTKNLEAVDSNGNTALLSACLWGLLPVVQELINKGANIEAIDKDGNTALILAARSAFPDIVALLKEKGAVLTTKNKVGKTAIDLAYSPEVKKVLQVEKAPEKSDFPKPALKITL